MTVIGISIGTNRTGACVLYNGKLIYRHIYSNQNRWSEKKLCRIINRFKRLINEYRVKGIIIKIPPLRMHNEPISQIISHIETLAVENDCAFDLVTKYELKQLTNLNSSEEIIAYTLLLFPELKIVYERAKDRTHSYFMKLYEAILSAYVFQDRLRVRSELKELQ